MDTKWQRRLLGDLRDRALRWADQSGLPWYTSEGHPPTVLFEPTPDGAAHGNFHPLSWQAIKRNPAWSQRLEKPHSQRRALPESKRASAKELDSSNSSDALLMNCFCFPDAAEPILSKLGLPYAGEVPEFGYAPGLWLSDGTRDDTEIDMRVGMLFVEAKLTEDDFTSRPKPHVQRYRALSSAFNVDALPADGESFSGYQLVRNVLAAVQHDASFVVLLDDRRPDLAEEWSDVAAAIRDTDLRSRCGFRTWQQVAAAAPLPLRDFLQRKYGL